MHQHFPDARDCRCEIELLAKYPLSPAVLAFSRRRRRLSVGRGLICRAKLDELGLIDVTGKMISSNGMRSLCKVIVDVSIFLEYSGEIIIDPDASIELLEQIANELQKMSGSERASLSKSIRDLAPQYGPRANFVTDLPSNLGISE